MDTVYRKSKITTITHTDPDNGTVVTQHICLYYVSEDGWNLYDTVSIVENQQLANRIADLWRTDSAIVEALLEQSFNK